MLLSWDLLRSLGDTDIDAFAIGAGDESPLLLGLGEARLDMAESDGVGTDAEHGTPLLSDGLGHARDARLRHGVVDLASVAVDAARRADVDDAAGLAVLDAEVRRRGPDQLEGRCAVQVQDRVPLLVLHLVDHPVPCVARIVHQDVNLAAAEVGRLLDQ